MVLVALKALEALALTKCSTGSPKSTGGPFNHAYRCMDWFLTVPLLLLIPLAMKLSGEVFSSKATLSMAFLCYIVYVLLVGPAAAITQESDAEIRCTIQTAQVMTVVSWGTYPEVYFFSLSFAVLA